MRLLKASRQFERFFDPRYNNLQDSKNTVGSNPESNEPILLGHIIDDFKNKREIFIPNV